MTKTGTLRMLLLLLPAFIFASCYDYSDKLEEAEDQVVAITNFDTKVQASTAYRTYAIQDSILILTSDASGNIVQTPNYNQYGQKIVDEVNTILEGKGYNQVQAGQDTNLLITLYAFQVTNIYTNWYYYYDYSDWYWDWYFPYDWYYPYPYYPYSYTTAYSVGTLVINAVDIKNPNNGKYPIVWTGSIRGVIVDGRSWSEIQGAIIECFDQGKFWDRN